MKKNAIDTHRISNRINVMLAVLACLFAAVAVKAFKVQVNQTRFYQREANKRQIRTETIPVSRGVIYDRNQEPLAISVAMESVWVDPALLMENFDRIDQLASKLDLDADKLKALVSSRQQRRFLYVKRLIDPELADEIRALNIDGVNFQTEFKRFYPAGETIAQLIGITNIEDQGQEGLERFFDEDLSGEPGLKRVVKDSKGNVIREVEEIRPVVPAQDLHISIDRRLQYAAYRSLKKAMYRYGARSASAVVMDVATGEVLALVNQPSFNPNKRDPEQLKKGLLNRAMMDVFEPGSVMKPFTVIAALESGKYTPETVIDTSPGRWEIDGTTVNDFRDYGPLTVEQIVAKSSNVGMAKIALDLEREHLWDVYRRFGFGRPTQNLIRSESAGYFPHYKKWRRVDQAALSRGYGLSVTVLQLATAYAAIANEGRWRSPSFIKGLINPDKAVIDPAIARQMRDILKAVVSAHATGHRAQIEGYSVAGKTGTARKNENGQYVDKYVATFAGFAPADHPRLVAVVSINDPAGDEFGGGQVAAPVFAEIMQSALRMLNVAPDRLPPGTDQPVAKSSTSGSTGKKGARP